MAALSSVYKAFPLDISKDEIRVLHLFPKNVSKVSEEKDQVLVSEVPIREGLAGVTRAEINTNSLEAFSHERTMAKPENNEPQESAGDFLAGLFEKFKGKSVDDLASAFTPESAKDAMAKIKDIRHQMERSGRPKPAESIAATLNCPLKDIHSTHTSSPLSGSLEVIPLQGNSNYIALSYVWGNEGQKLPFILNGHNVEITENLAIALQNLQSPDGVVHLWVDAVCINQEDKNEKSEQVRKMKTIYENASSVLVWLGPASNHSDRIMDYAIENGPGYVEKGGYLTANTTFTEGPEVVKTYLEASPNMGNLLKGPQMAKLVDALHSLLYRDYWHRVWVLQEIAVAKNVVVACGNKKCPLEAFETVAVTMTHIITSSATHLMSTTSWVELTAQGSPLTRSPVAAPALRMLKERRWYQTKVRRQLTWILTFARSIGVTILTDTRLRATDPRDHVYALLGMASNTEQLGIIPDYNKSIEDIYTEVAGKILEHDFDLLLMSQKGSSQQVPSWVPDWREDLKESPGNCAGFQKPFRAYGQVQPILPSLCKHGPTDIPTILEVTGTRVDVVSYTGAVFRKEEIQNSSKSTGLLNVQLFLSQIENLCHRSAALNSKVYGDPKIWLKDALARIPVGDCEKISPEGDRRRLSETSKSRYEALIAFLDMINNPVDENQVSDMLMSGWSKFMLYLVDMYRLMDRRPFITENGYVGVGPAGMLPGDVVSIFFGAHVPYGIRQESENPLRFSLVGDAYVYGIMDGEFMTTEFRKEVFELI